MTTITFIQPSGVDIEVNATPGHSLMQAAVDNMVDGILADCGGSCSCATCHCYIDEKYLNKIPPASATEKSMLDFVIEPNDFSRLSCQVIVTEDLEGMVVKLPPSQF
ncbi:MAG TPA: 2Fe-2S iron-sulfur cluster-binding protein [Pseudomonadales bacterium]|nr:2Fe-2S iron-sulfur cluster-binding protein [Pseudomonadales bacterium]